MTATRVNPRARRPLLLIAGMTAGLLGAAGVVSAAEPASEAPAITVQFGDLNIHSQAGAQVLYHRILAAAAAVCPSGDIRDLDAYDAGLRCRARAVREAVRQVHSAEVAALYQASTDHG
jgi:UrcA family protein